MLLDKFDELRWRMMGKVPATTPDWMLSIDKYARRAYARRAMAYSHAIAKLSPLRRMRKFKRLQDARDLCLEWSKKASKKDIGPLADEIYFEYRAVIYSAIEAGKPVPKRIREGDLWQR